MLEKGSWELAANNWLGSFLSYRLSIYPNLLVFEDNATHDKKMVTDHPTICRRHNHVHAAYVNAALVIKQFDLRQAENMLLREGVPRKVIARILLVGHPYRNIDPSSWKQQFAR